MSSYYPPTEDINVFNTALFTNEPDAISQGQGSLLYLSKVNSDTSTAPQTNFTGNVSFTVLPQSSAVPSNLPDLVNKNYTDTTFQTIANMVNYLTTSVASATYQTISGMSAYLTTAIASTTYQTIAGMSAYVDIASPQTITGLKLFTNNLEVYNATANLTLRVSSGTTQQSTIKQNASQLQLINNSTTPTIVFTVSSATKLTVSPTQCLLDATCFLTTNDIKSRAPTGAHTLLSDITSGTLTISSTTASNTINGATTFSQTATFSVIPTCSITATSASQLVNYTTLTSQSYTTLPIIQANANAWTNTNTFNSFLPTSTISASSGTQLVNYTTLTGQGYTTLALVQANNNAWTGTNSFNSFLPTSTITATTANQLVNYTTLTGQSYTTLALVQANNNAWTGTNSFNSFLPTSTITATTANQLVNYTTLTGQSYTTLALVQANNNIWTGTNQYNQLIKVQYATPQYTELDHTAQVFHIRNKSVSGSIRVLCQTAGAIDTTLAVFNTTGISIGVSSITNTISGPTTFNNYPSTALAPVLGDHLVNRTYADTKTTLSEVQSNNNAFTGFNTFNTNLPTSTISASSGNQLVNYTTLTGQGYTTLALVQSNNNAFTGTNTFNTNLPTSTISATLANQLVNFTCLNAQSFVKPSSNNAWTGTNSFNTSIPTTTITATLASEIVNFTTLNAQSFVKPSSNNAWTGTNSFNTSIPTTTITATLASQLVNYTTLTTQGFTTLALVQSNNNAFTGTNTFNSSLPTSTLTPSSGTQLITKTFADGTYIDFTTDQTITASNKRFARLHTTTLNISPTVGGSGNRQEIYITGTNLAFNPVFNSNTYTFYCKDAVPNTTSPLEINSSTTTISNALSITGLATFSNGAVFNTVIPTTSISATSANELVNYTTLTSQSYTTLALVQSNANTFSAINTFNTNTNLNGQLNLKNNFVLYDLAGLVKNTRIYQSGNDISFTPSNTGGAVSTNYYFDALNSGGTNVNILKLTSSDATINGNAIITGTANITGTSTLGATNISGTTSITGGTTISGATTLSGATTSITGTTTISGGTTISGATTISNALTLSNNTTYSAATININSSTTTHDTNFFTAITTGTHAYLSSLSNNAIFNMFSVATSNVNFYINARVRFRNVKFYNQVKTYGGGTLTFPLEETILINNGGNTTITLPVITANAVGMTFNFIKNNSFRTHTFTAQGTDTIVKNGDVAGTTTVNLFEDGITSLQLVIVEMVASSNLYNWVVVSSLPAEMSNPVGSILTMSVVSTPAGYFACAGQTASTTTYANLFAVIGYTYGGSGATFNLPNFNNGSFLRGTGGNASAIGTQQGENIKTHTHTTTFQRYQRGSSTGARAIGLEGTSTDTPPTTDGVSDPNTAGSPDETRPLNFAVHYCIKY